MHACGACAVLSFQTVAADHATTSPRVRRRDATTTARTETRRGWIVGARVSRRATAGTASGPETKMRWIAVAAASRAACRATARMVQKIPTKAKRTLTAAARASPAIALMANTAPTRSAWTAEASAASRARASTAAGTASRTRPTTGACAASGRRGARSPPIKALLVSTRSISQAIYGRNYYNVHWYFTLRLDGCVV